MGAGRQRRRPTGRSGRSHGPCQHVQGIDRRPSRRWNVSPEVGAAIAEVEPKLDAYIAAAQSISAQAPDVDTARAETAFPDFAAAFSDLEVKMGNLGDLVESTSKAVGDSAIDTNHVLLTVLWVVGGGDAAGAWRQLRQCRNDQPPDPLPWWRQWCGWPRATPISMYRPAAAPTRSGKWRPPSNVFRRMPSKRGNCARHRTKPRPGRKGKERALREMADTVERETNRVVDAISKQTAQMTANAKQMSQSAGNVSENSQTVATAATEAQANVGTVAQASEQLSASIGDIAKQIVLAKKATGEAVEASTGAQKIIANLSNAVTQISAVANSSTTSPARPICWR